jgi:hypothetical protein
MERNQFKINEMILSLLYLYDKMLIILHHHDEHQYLNIIL